MGSDPLCLTAQAHIRREAAALSRCQIHHRQQASFLFGRRSVSPRPSAHALDPAARRQDATRPSRRRDRAHTPSLTQRHRPFRHRPPPRPSTAVQARTGDSRHGPRRFQRQAGRRRRTPSSRPFLPRRKSPSAFRTTRPPRPRAAVRRPSTTCRPTLGHICPSGIPSSHRRNRCRPRRQTARRTKSHRTVARPLRGLSRPPSSQPQPASRTQR